MMIGPSDGGTFVQLTQWPSVLYWRLSEFLLRLCGKQSWYDDFASVHRSKISLLALGSGIKQGGHKAKHLSWPRLRKALHDPNVAYVGRSRSSYVRVIRITNYKVKMHSSLLLSSAVGIGGCVGGGWGGKGGCIDLPSLQILVHPFSIRGALVTQSMLAYDAKLTKSDGAKIDEFLYSNSI